MGLCLHKVFSTLCFMWMTPNNTLYNIIVIVIFLLCIWRQSYKQRQHFLVSEYTSIPVACRTYIGESCTLIWTVNPPIPDGRWARHKVFIKVLIQVTFHTPVLLRASAFNQDTRQSLSMITRTETSRSQAVVLVVVRI